MRPGLSKVSAALCCLYAGAAAPPPRTVDLAGAELRVADLAIVPTRLGRSIGELVVARVPAATGVLELSVARQNALLRHRVPGHDLALRHSETLLVRGTRRPRARKSPSGCLAVAGALDAGEYLDRQKVVPAPCRDTAVRPPLAFDRNVRGLRAIAPLPAGTYLGRIVVAPGIVSEAGAAYELVFHQGPVTVERKVRLALPARNGAAALARTGDDKVVGARLAVGDMAGPPK